MTFPKLLRWPDGRWLGALALIACDRDPPPAPTPTSRASSVSIQVGTPELPGELLPKARTTPGAAPAVASASPTGVEAAAAGVPTSWSIAPALPADYKGPFLYVTALAAGVYTEASFESKKLGYLRNGSRVPIASAPTSKKNCTGGWYAVTSGGFVCGNLGTTDANNPEVRFAGATPNLEDVLPYPYARNAKNGTPLYRTVPSREQMERYEPYLLEKSEPSPSASASTTPKSETKPVADVAEVARHSGDVGEKMGSASDIGAALAQGTLVTAPASPDPEPEKPWWQRENSKDRLHELKLQELESDADDVLAKRMVSGFYVAVDKTFRWNGRAWYKTTKGLVAPSDRFWQTAGPKFKGVELDGTTWKLPVAWVYGGRKSVGTYFYDPGTKALKNAKSPVRFEPMALSGKTQEIAGTTYAELTDGSWVKRSQVRITAPGPLPAGLAPGERWIDVNLSTQTLVAFVGDRPVYTTMISSGKESKIKDKDHRTPTGEWRVREKHITTTMDGDGTAAGDLPYSIEDVPYVLYFHRSFALHGAFWHNNFGVQMSHGCVNLAPLDAKYLFFFADPPIPAGFHGVWSSDAHPGTRVVVHE
jgi:lipoprotein-anchoring transpeptidase ErfK/SrfK